MQGFVAIVAFSILVEGITENLKMLFPDQSLVGNLVPIIVAVLFSVSFSVNIFDHLGFVSIVPFLGEIGTGLLVSRGSNYIHDLVSMLNNNEISEESVD